MTLEYMPKVDAIVLNFTTSDLSAESFLVSSIKILEVDIFHILDVFGMFLTFLTQSYYSSDISIDEKWGS